MTGKEIVLEALQGKVTPRVPWVPFVGVHGGKLLGVTATEYLKSEDLIVKGASKAIEMYKADGIPVAFDLQIEAEVLGCDLVWADDNPPAVSSHPITSSVDIATLEVPCRCKGRIPTVMNATQRLREMHPDVALYGLITGPFTLALHLMGTDIFIGMFTEIERVHQIMTYANKVAKAMAGWYIESGVDIVAVVDPMTSQIDAGSFESFVSPYTTDLFDHIRACGAKSSFFVCGNAKQNIEIMCKSKPDNLSIDENIALDYVRDVCIANNVSFGGNLMLTVSLLMGSEEDCKWDAIKCLEIGGTKGFILAPGCDLAYDTPSNNLQAVAEMVLDPYQRDIIKAKGRTEGSIELLDLGEHFNDKRVVIDVITLDSTACAACQYMVEAVRIASEGFESKDVIWREHSIKSQAGLQMMASLGVQSIPTVVMDGTVEFISNIPPANKIAEAISKHLDKKR